MLKTVTARRLICGSHEIQYPVLTLQQDGTIVDIGTDERALANDMTTLTAALFDIHIHGSWGIDFMNAGAAEFLEVQGFLAQHGVARFLPTTVTAPIDFTLRALDRMADAIETSDRSAGVAQPVGIHVEGPFLSHSKRGMHPADALQAPSIELFEKMQQAARGHIRLATIAPEPHAGPFRHESHRFAPCTALELIRHLADKGVRCSIGHTNANESEASAAIAAGAVSATHTFNAMRALDHRQPGALGVVLDDDRLYADLICDGVHVAASAVRLWWKAKGSQRSILITDALSATGMGNGEYVAGDTAVVVGGERALVSSDLRSGKETLAGSILTLERAIGKLRAFTGASLAQATGAASHNPAAMLGFSGQTRIEPGTIANLVRWDENGNLLATYICGEEIPR